MAEEVRTADWQLERDAIRSVRDAVFVREQGVDPEIEWDSADDTAQHFLALSDGKAVGTGRLTLEGKIGRMAVLQSMRGTGLGQRLLEQICTYAREQNLEHVYLHAQCHAEEFYRKAGFVSEGDTFMEAGITHIKMVRHFS